MASRVPPYGTVISDALGDPKSTLSTLKALRTRGYDVLKSHGDLKGSLKKLDQAIKARAKAAKK